MAIQVPIGVLRAILRAPAARMAQSIPVLTAEADFSKFRLQPVKAPVLTAGGRILQLSI